MEKTYLHPFTTSGLGEAPFNFIGVEEKLYYPCKNLDGSINTSVPPVAGGVCDHCGTGIRYVYKIKSADGKVSGVGCDCINKTDDAKLVTVAHAEKLKIQREKRREKAAERRETLRLERLQKQRDKNGGLTDYELHQKIAEERTAKWNKFVEKMLPEIKQYIDILEDGRGGFRDSIASSLSKCDLPRGNGYFIMLEILAKSLSGSKRVGTKAFEAKYEEVKKHLDEVGEKIEAYRKKVYN